MRTLISLDAFRNEPVDRVLAVGFFDGVHRGHQSVVKHAIQYAAAAKAQCWALTFDRHPLSLLAPERRPPLMTPLPHRLELLAGLGLDGCLALPFTAETAALPPEDFIAKLVGKNGRLHAIFCGPNWHFGQHGRGNPARLNDFARAMGFEARIVPPVLYRGAPISSTRIRRAIHAARLAEAAAMLGRIYTIRETVVRGRGIGRTLGMATANLHPEYEVLPPHGVYAVHTWIGDRRVDGVANLGVRPSFRETAGSPPVLELHLLDFEADLYGCTLDIGLVARLRDEQRFKHPDLLVRQVRDDIQRARRILVRTNDANPG